MSMTLNLADRLLALGRKFRDLGREHDALYYLGRLTTLAELPGDVAEEAQVHLAEIMLRRRKFVRARRHLTAALRHQPDSARYHYLMATAADGGSKADPERATRHYLRSLELDDQQQFCHAEYGLLALRLGRMEEGVGHLCRALEQSPNDPELVGMVVSGFRLANRRDEARDVLRAARFRNPHDSRFRKLWDDFHFQQLRREQEAARQGKTVDEVEEDGPVLLPFVRPAPGMEPIRLGRRIRQDPAAPAQPPHLPRPVRLPNQRHAQ